jgi:hypothetical protein
MFKKLRKLFSKKASEVEGVRPAIFGFIATLKGVDDLGDAVPTQIFIIPKEEEENIYNIVKTGEYNTLVLYDNNRIQFKPPTNASLLLTPFYSVEELNGALKSMRDQGVRGVVGWPIPIDY